MAYTVAENTLVGQPIAETLTVKKHDLGTIVRAKDPTFGAGEFIYLKGVASTVVGSLVQYDENLGTTTLAPATGGHSGPLAVAMSANVANQFGWYQIAGAANIKAGAMAASANVFMLAATPGSVSNVVVAGEQVLNAVGSAAPVSGLALVQINRPFLQGQIT